jgi:hypothetical protein
LGRRAQAPLRLISDMSLAVNSVDGILRGTITTAISETEALICSAAAATDCTLHSVCAVPATARERASMLMVTSVAYLTILNGFPFMSRIGLYVAWIETFRPLRPTRSKIAEKNSPRRRRCQKSWYSRLAA